MKILKDKYPMGSFKWQKSPGRYIDNYLYKNLEVMADKIVDDMTFLGIIFSSTLEVGTGKSVFVTQMGEAWTEIVNRKHNLNIPFTDRNLVFRPQELIDRSFELGNENRYACVILDEWEDANYWSSLGMNLRQFFRKCRQLNLFILCIIPNWFQLNLSYAVSRSAFAIDVRFGTGFKRGFFTFYGFENKKQLYIKGKKFHNYKCARADFYGSFTDGYGIPEVAYRKAKLNDMIKWESDDDKDKRKSIPQMEADVKAGYTQKLFKLLQKYNITRKEYCETVVMDPKTFTSLKNRKIEKEDEKVLEMGGIPTNPLKVEGIEEEGNPIIKNLLKKGDNVGEEGADEGQE